MGMNKLADLPNIGRVLEKKLHEVEVNGQEELKNLGAKEAFLRIQRMDPTACLHMLYALEGAVQGIRYTQLTQEEKQGLKDFYNEKP